jgi:serine protease Do
MMNPVKPLFQILLTCAVLLPIGAYAASEVGFGLGPRPAPEAPSSFADLAEKLLPTVVNISSTQKSMAVEDMPDMPQFPPGSPFEDFFKDFMDKHGHNGDSPMAPQASLGSGFIIDTTKGYIVTNNHVIRDASEIRVTLHDNTTLDAKVVGYDEKTDLAVLKVDPAKGKLVAASFGNSDIMRVGDWVLAIGNPFGLGGTVTAGIISARARDINSGPYDDYIQTDASINRGNSGGPMFNTRGDIIGINTAIFSPSGGSVGIGFAIPSSLAKPVVDQIIQYGRTRRGWIGVRIQSVNDEIADSLGLGKVRGALIASVTPKGPAELAGLQAGDIVTAFNGQAVGEMRQLPRLVAESAINSEANLTVWRNGAETNIKIKVAELEQAEKDGMAPTGKPDSKKGLDQDKGVEIPSLGMTLGMITAQDRDDMELPDGTNGVAVLSLKKDGEAAAKGLDVGDIILEINQQKIEDPKAAARIINAAQKAGKASVLLLVDTQGKGDVRFVALKLKK